MFTQTGRQIVRFIKPVFRIAALRPAPNQLSIQVQLVTFVGAGVQAYLGSLFKAEPAPVSSYEGRFSGAGASNLGARPTAQLRPGQNSFFG